MAPIAFKRLFGGVCIKFHIKKKKSKAFLHTDTSVCITSCNLSQKSDVFLLWGYIVLCSKKSPSSQIGRDSGIVCLSVPAAILGRQFWGVPEILAHSVRVGLDLLPLPSLHRFSSVDEILEPELQCEDKGHGGGGRVWGELSWEKQSLVTRVPAESVWAGPRGGLRSNPSALLTTRWPREAPSGLPSLLCGAEVGVWGILQSVSQWAISSSPSLSSPVLFSLPQNRRDFWARYYLPEFSHSEPFFKIKDGISAIENW